MNHNEGKARQKNMTRFQLILPVDSQNVIKGHRMHVGGPKICQINHWNNSFQSVYGML